MPATATPTRAAAEFRPTYDEDKMQELLVYVAQASANDVTFGKTKLNKILYYIDFHAYASLGEPVTGAQYQHRPYGPVPTEIASARSRAIQSGALEAQTVEHFGRKQERLVPKRQPNISLFSNEEKEIIDFELARLRPYSGTAVSELSHQDLGWRITKDGEDIRYETVFLSGRRMTRDDVRRGQRVWARMQG